MEADWEIEIAPDAAAIDAVWKGLVDLRADPARVAEIGEAVEFPALAKTLLRLNSASSPVRTTKCDVWPVEEFDPDELDADRDTAICALGCYIDLVASSQESFSTLDATAEWCRRLCLELRAKPANCCRVDAIVRRAFFDSETEGLAVTVYATACGTSPAGALEVLSKALDFLSDSLIFLRA